MAAKTVGGGLVEQDMESELAAHLDLEGDE